MASGECGDVMILCRTEIALSVCERARLARKVSFLTPGISSLDLRRRVMLFNPPTNTHAIYVCFSAAMDQQVIS